MSISIIIPVFNEEENIEQCLKETQEAFKGTDYEIIVVNDGSTDQSEAIIRKNAEKNPKIKCLSHSPNRGYGFAVRTGIQKAKKEFVSYLDADLQYSPFELKKMLDFCQQQNAVFVLGKPGQKYSSRLRQSASSVYNWLAKKTLRLDVQDANSLKIIRTQAIQKLGLREEKWMIDLEIVAKLRQQKTIPLFFPIRVQPRKKGKSKLRFRPRLAWETLKAIQRLRKKRGTKPPRTKPNAGKPF